MRYKLGETIWARGVDYYYRSDDFFGVMYSEKDLIRMGAVPIDDKPEKIENLDNGNVNPFQIVEKINQVIDWINNHEKESNE